MTKDATTRPKGGDHDTAVRDGLSSAVSILTKRGAVQGPTGVVLTHEAHQTLIGIWCLYKIADDGIDGLIRRGIPRSTAYKARARFRAFYGCDFDDGAPFRPSERKALLEALSATAGIVPDRGSKALR